MESQYVQVKRSRWPMLVAGLVLGLVLGGGGVALGWVLSSSGGGGSTAANDADAACALLERMSSELDPSKQLAEYHRWGAVVSLAAAAAEEDRRYKDLADATRVPMNIVHRSFDGESPEFADAVAEARLACAAR